MYGRNTRLFAIYLTHFVKRYPIYKIQHLFGGLRYLGWVLIWINLIREVRNSDFWKEDPDLDRYPNSNRDSSLDFDPDSGPDSDTGCGPDTDPDSGPDCDPVFGP